MHQKMIEKRELLPSGRSRMQARKAEQVGLELRAAPNAEGRIPQGGHPLELREQFFAKSTHIIAR